MIRATGESTREFGTGDPELERYLNAIEGADALIARLIDELDRRGLRESTVVAITGDHGEVFGQHGQRVHSFAVYEENVHVPLVILHPGLRDSPRRFTGLCQQCDIPATLLGLLGAPRPEAWQGRDVLSEGPRPRAYFFAVSNEIWLGVRQGHLKYHYAMRSGREELFDLSADPNEATNLAVDERARCEELRGRLATLVQAQRAHLASHGSP